MDIGYGRVSARDQNPRLQREALIAAGVSPERIYVDKLSGKLRQRPELDRALEQLRSGDTLVVWKLDRLGRDNRHLIEVLWKLKEQEIGFRSLTEGIDTNTKIGELLYAILAWLAEAEHERILERAAAGRESARRNGKMGGRPTKLPPDKARLAQQLAESGEYPMDKIAEMLGVHRSTLYRHLSQQVDKVT